MRDFLSGSQDLSSVTEASELVRRAAEPRQAGENIKAAIVRVARLLKWRIGRTRKIWYAEAALIRSEEMDQLRRFRAEQAARYSRVAEAMQAVDPEFYADEINSLVHASRVLGGKEAAD